MVLCPRCCGCGPAELVCSLVHCLSVSIQLLCFGDDESKKGRFFGVYLYSFLTLALDGYAGAASLPGRLTQGEDPVTTE